MKLWRRVLLFSLILALTAACGGEAPAPESATTAVESATQPAAATELPAADTGQPPTPTGEAPSAATLPAPTATLQATVPAQESAPAQGAEAAAAATRIQFDAGATDAIVTGHLTTGGSARYVLAASGGQIMRVSLSPDMGQAILVIWGADGDVLISDHAGAAYWTGTLPRTQDYYIDVRAAPDTTVDYTLQVVIPERIQFPAGGTSASVQGRLPAAGSHSYVLGAQGGQTMTVNLTYPSGMALLIIWGADGDVLISDHADAQQWSGTLPSTQDYYIDVRAAAGSSPVAYTLQVSIPPAGDQEPEATRIQFKPGKTSATLNGHLAAGATRRYVLRAAAGQTMTVRLTPGNAPAYLVIWGEDGSVMLSGNWQSKEYSGVLTISQDYFIDVKSSGSQAVAYALTVTIPPAGQEEPQAKRIQFPAGGTSATVKDSVSAGGGKRYVLGAMAGQTMLVELMYPSGQALIAIWGADGDVLISDHAGAQQWSGTLPRTQDYYIDVRAAAGGASVAYTLLVTIPPLSQPEPHALRIEFPAGGTSATVEDHLAPGGVHRYVLRAMAGQTMTVRLTPAGVPAYLVIWGADGSVLLSGTWGWREWSGVLTLTEDYYIDVKSSASTGIQYNLRVEIPPK